MSGEIETAQPKKRTAPKEVRRKQLIMAAIDSISKRGFSDTTLRHVTEAAGLSHGVVNYHFDSKEALYDATLGYLAQEHYGMWSRYLADAGNDAAQQLESIIRADFDKKICTHTKLAVWFAFWGQAKYRPNYIKIHNKYDNERDQHILELCSQLIASGGYTNLEAERAARMIETQTDGAWLSLLLYPKVAPRQELLQDCLDLLARLFPDHYSV
ncbi:MAG: TetR/AcrR family transcriptional regulator [Paracoccaceae bacterium]|nr:TetR/AcrR family transcriptional regulator [Paracoccaceae bacterium]MDG1737660.1 TetR/AcrR family transcriptional regulator [Paracoccaceae bacterium]MDG2257661.1 TetR/AcrR family transcriptional regulator [Paracoccaceae bacterium]